MKIVMVNLEGSGGMFQYSSLLTNSLAKNEEVTAIVPMGTEKDYFTDSVKVIPLVVGDTKRSFIKNFLDGRKFVKLLKIIRLENPDIIHFQNPYNPWTCPLLPFLTSYGIVVSIPEGTLHWGMEKRLEMIFSRQLHVYFSNALIALCPFDKKIIKAYAKNKKIYIIPHGVNTVFLKYAKENVLEEDSILFFGV